MVHYWSYEIACGHLRFTNFSICVSLLVFLFPVNSSTQTVLYVIGDGRLFLNPVKQPLPLLCLSEANEILETEDKLK